MVPESTVRGAADRGSKTIATRARRRWLPGYGVSIACSHPDHCEAGFSLPSDQFVGALGHCVSESAQLLDDGVAIRTVELHRVAVEPRVVVPAVLLQDWFWQPVNHRLLQPSGIVPVTDTGDAVRVEGVIIVLALFVLKDRCPVTHERLAVLAHDRVHLSSFFPLALGQKPAVLAPRLGAMQRIVDLLDMFTAPPAPQVPPAGSSVAVAADVVLISCVKTKLPHPAPARDLYTSDYFVSMRRYAEASRLPWFILSAEHGLIAPDDVLAPYDCYLPSMGRGYQREWGYRVARQLEEAVGSLKGKVFDLHASSTYSTAVRRGLEGSGATIVDQLRGLTMGHRLSWYKNPNQSQTQPAAPIDLAPLKDGAHALTLQEWLDSQRNEPREAGLYSWWVNKPGAEELTLGLGHVVRQGLLYAGSAGATRASGTRSTNTLWGRIGTMHLGSKQQFSTLRRSLMGILSSARGHSVSESELTEWMHDHLRLVTVAVADRDSVDALERELLRELDPR